MTKDTFLFEKYSKEIIKHTSELIKIPSVSGSKEVVKALEYMKRLATSLGFECKNIENAALEINLGKGKEVIGILAHLDVVPPGEGWTRKPFMGEIEEGCVYGRGATDNKGPAIATLFCMKALMENGSPMDRTIRLILGTSEESSPKDMEIYFSKRKMPTWGFSPDASYPIINREKGITDIDLEKEVISAKILSIEGGLAYNMVPDSAKAILNIDNSEKKKIEACIEKEDRIKSLNEDGKMVLVSKGISSHGAVPENGLNAISILLEFLEKVKMLPKELTWYNKLIGYDTKGEGLNIALEDELSGKLSVNIGKISYDTNILKLGLNIRYPVTFRIDDISNLLNKKLSDYGILVFIKKNMDPLYVKENCELIQKLKKGYYKATGKEAKCLSMGGGTYARAMKNRAVAYGAFLEGCKSKGAHRPDEVVYVEDLKDHFNICYHTLIELSKKE